MKIGTRTVLFGVHQFLWHPFTVYRAWRWLYGRRPNWWQTIAIFFHDAGYIGLPNLDGKEGRQHPVRGAKLAGDWAEFIAHFFCSPSVATSYQIATAELAVGHSRELSREIQKIPSLLCWADKACVLFDPPWFYLLRARLAGELPEFKRNAEPQIGKVADEVWLDWYRNRVRSLLRGLDLRDSVIEDIDAGRR